MRVIKLDGREYAVKINARAEKLFKQATGKRLLDVGSDIESLLSLEIVSQAFWALCSSTGKIEQTLEDFELIDVSEFLNAAPDVVAEVKEKFEDFSGDGGPLGRIAEMILSVTDKAKTLTGALSGHSEEEGSASPADSTSTASSGT